MFQISKGLWLPQQSVKSAVETFYIGVSPRLFERNKNQFNAKVKAKTGYLSKRSGMIQAASKRCFVINLQVPGHAKDFPIINKKVYNAVCAFAVILLQVGLTGTDIYSIDGDNNPVAFDVSGGNQIKLMHMARVSGFDFRIICSWSILFCRFGLRNNQSVAFQNPVDGW